MENQIENVINQSEVTRSNPKYMPQARYTMRFGGITTNRVKTKRDAFHRVVRVHFFIDTPFHGRRKFYKQYHPHQMGQLEHDLRHYFDRLYPSTTKSLKKRFSELNRFKGKYADIRLANVSFCPRFGIISGVSEFHGYFRYQEFIASQQVAAHGTLAH